MDIASGKGEAVVLDRETCACGRELTPLIKHREDAAFQRGRQAGFDDKVCLWNAALEEVQRYVYNELRFWKERGNGDLREDGARRAHRAVLYYLIILKKRIWP